MSNQAFISMMRRQAVETLEKSTKMFEQALNLLREGKRTEAEKLRAAARAKRNDSIWLMEKATKFERDELTRPAYPVLNRTTRPLEHISKSINHQPNTSVSDRDTQPLNG